MQVFFVGWDGPPSPAESSVVGPYGPYWCGPWLYEFTWLNAGVSVRKVDRRSWDDCWEVFFRVSVQPWVRAFREPLSMLKYIRAAEAVVGGGLVVTTGNDPVLYKDRPALREYMTSLEGPGGECREPSVLMIALGEDGIRCGLKDEAAGGWLWREGSSLAKCLDALEKCLADGSGKFRGPKSQRGKKQR